MKPTATKLVKITALMSVCASVSYVAHVVSREVAYVHAKVNRSTSTDAPRQELRWPEAVALPELRVPSLKVQDQLGADD